MAIENLNLPILSTPITTDYYTSWAGNVPDTRTLMSTLGSNFLNWTTTGEHEIYNNGLLQIIVKTKNHNNDPTELENLYINNIQTSESYAINNPNYQWNLYLAIGYDINFHKAYCFMVGQFYYNGEWNQSNYHEITISGVVDAVIGSIIPQYTWSPVNKINGKMGNVNLSQIIYLNDGDPVTGADSEDVTFVDESGLDVLIEKATWVDDAVTVEYYIPNDTFEYVKLVYKYGDVPVDINDGTAIDLDPNKTSLVITDIENPDNYWFIIFTDKSCSLGYELIINQDTALYNLLSGMF